MIRAALFDIGNVILPFDFAPAMSRLRARSGRAVPAAWEEVERIKLAYEEGAMSRRDFLAKLRAEIDFDGTDKELVAIWSDVFASNPPMDAFIERLHAGGTPLYLLSNTSDIHVETFARFPVFSRFAGAIYSHEERMMKPDAEMFQRAIRKFHIVPAETLYIDDLAPNVDAARNLGFIALSYDYRDHEAFETEVAKWLEQRG